MSMKKKVVIGMSGGVDSSVAAWLLKEQGYEVIGVTMQIWQEEDPDQVEENGGCCGLSAVEDARRVAARLDIPYYVMNFRKEFQEHVIDYFTEEYLRGRTPNPCIPVRPDGFYPMNGMMTSFVILMVVFQGIDWLGEKRWLPGLAAVVLPLAWPILAGLLMRGVPALQMPLLALGYTLLPMWNSNPDASISVIATGVLLYAFRRNRRVQAGAFVAGTMVFSFLLPLLLLFQSPEFHWTMMFTTAYEWYGALAVALMLCYNGERGRGPKAFFYAFYPAHVYILYALSWAAYPLLAGG